MLHHISFPVSNIEKASAFYDAVLFPLGYRRVCSGKDFVGYGIEENKDKFLLKAAEGTIEGPSSGFHMAFAAPNRAAVDAFHTNALKYGGKDNGLPGLRPHYGSNYYAAFIIDLDGYRIEAVINT